jgi:hypothetical protein
MALNYRLGGSAATVLGVDDVLERMNAEIKAMKGPKTRSALTRAALLVSGRAKVYTPVATGFLRSTAYWTIINAPEGPGAEIGYWAAYAPFVHEIDKNYVKPGTGWKFLERALQESATEILKIFGSTLDLTKQMEAEAAFREDQGPSSGSMSDETGWIG